MLTLIALSAALMQDPPAPPPPPPEMRSHVFFVGGAIDGPGRLDADGDGQVTRDEFAAPLNNAFGRMDKDGDGRLSSEELAADRGPDGDGVRIRRRGGGDVEHFELRRDGLRGARVERDGGATVFVTPDRLGDESRVIVHARRDGDGPRVIRFGHGPDGRPGRIETDGEHAMIFVRPDGRGEDGEVIVRALRDGDGPRVIHFDHGPEVIGDGRVEIRTMGGPGHGPDDLDKDGDGKVSEAEFTAPLREAFARMDADHSGFIDDGENGGENQVHIFARRIEQTDGE